jgi:hypothetical protein
MPEKAVYYYAGILQYIQNKQIFLRKLYFIYLYLIVLNLVAYYMRTYILLILFIPHDFL